MTRTNDMKERERQFEAEQVASEKLHQLAKNKKYEEFCIYADKLESNGFKVSYLGESNMWNANIVKNNWEMV